MDKTRTVQFDIPELRADRALTLFAEQAEVTFIFPYREATHRKANKLKGEFALEEGLSILLKGSGLQAVFDKEHGIAVTALEGNTIKGEKNMGIKKTTSGSFLTRLVAGITAAFSLNGAALAEERPDTKRMEIQEIIVTARYREESPQDIGASIKAVSGRELERGGITDFEDIAYRTVGLDMLDRGPNQNEISIRGISKPIGGATADTLTSNPVVTLFLDDIPVTTNSANQRDFNFFDFDRVEILRGPQPTLFGEGSVGGTIRYFSRDPSLEPGVDGTVNAAYSTTEDGGDNTLVQAAVGITLIENVLGMRLTAYQRNDDGFIDNVAINKDDANDFESTGGRAVVLFEPNEQLTLRLFAHIGRDDAGEQWRIDPSTSPDKLVSNLPFDGSVEDDFELYGLKASYEFKNLTLTSITGHYERKRTSALYDPNFTYAVANAGWQLLWDFFSLPSAPETNKFLTYDEESFTQEFRFVSDFDGPLNITAGLFYQDSDFDQDYLAQVPGIAPFTVNNTDAYADSLTKFSSKQKSIFAELTYEATEYLRLIAGVRYVKEDLTGAFDPAGTIFSPNFPPIAPIVYAPLFASVGLTTKFDFVLEEFLPRFAVEYDVNDHMMAYFNASKGARNGGLNPPLTVLVQATSGFTAPLNQEVFKKGITYDEDATTAYETGLKSSFLDQQLTVNTAFFLNKWDDIQSVCCTPLSIVVNDTDAEIYGLEVESLWSINPNLQVFANVNFTEAEFTDDVALGAIKDGNKLSGVPDYSYSVGMEGSLPILEGDLAFIYHADYQYIDERYSSASNLKTSILPDIGILNLRAGVESRHFSLVAFVNNVTNEIKAQSSTIIDSDASVPPFEIFVNRPRTMGVSLTYNF